MLARHKVDMGGVRKPVFTDRCPWASVYLDRIAEGALTAYGARERFGLLPPGRTDPRLLEAMSIIASEHNRIMVEDLKKK